ncbi:NACHT domain-containing protein [Pseudochrobactrum algeriensis]|uniref:NACHT domain-containing protein n=1 Tax=Pseudochrobactrum algeriensis TaxID=2834768 RepID=UPI001BCD5146|nr:ATP-binding protein [Pseudochrobactrum algeriensis]QVQ39244.1 ATP-binding protein [Pseudochrobactrum algeriensis]QVQ43164.1 ATP-binding protein [Pseudochrobactrum algeriensis]
MDNSQYISLSRRFVEIQSTDFENEPDSIWASLAMRKTGKTWEEILSNDVSILLGTAGSGKTTEVRQQVQHLVEAGQDAFLMRLEALQDDSLVGSFDFGLDDQGERFDIWKRSKKGGVLFFDALDEARLPSSRNESALEKALDIVSREIGRRLGPIHVVITSRPSEWFGDGDVRRLTRFIRQTRNAKQDLAVSDPSCRTFRLAPLTTGDIEKLAVARGVNSSDFISAVSANLAIDLIQQPLDAHLFLDVWKKAVDEGRTPEEVFKSRLQVMRDLVAWRLFGRSESKDRLNIDINRARKAAAKLAAFVVLSGERDFKALPLTTGDAINAAQILSTDVDSWTGSEVRELLASGLFQPSVGGRIRFAHREIQDFLAAEHFDESLRARAHSERTIAPLLAEGLGQRSIPQSTEHVMGWLATLNSSAKAVVANVRPALLIETGDPQSLSIGDKEVALRNQARLYDDIRYRGEWFSHDDVKRFTHPELWPVVDELLDKSSSPELTDFLIEIARFGQMKSLAPKLVGYVRNPDIGYRTKAEACAALDEFGDQSFRADILLEALMATTPNVEDADAAPDWNMFQLKALKYVLGEATLLDAIAILSRIQRERANYSSATSKYLIEIVDGLSKSEKQIWLSILLRFAFSGRDENRYRMPNASARYKRFVPAIVYLATELVVDEDVRSDDSDLLDAVEMALGKDDRIDVFSLNTPMKRLTDGLRSRSEVKHALIQRRVALFPECVQRSRVPFGAIYPLEIRDKEENGYLFHHSDVSHYCELASEATDLSKRVLYLDLAGTILRNLRGDDHEYALGQFRQCLKKYGDKEQTRQFGIHGWLLRTKSRCQHQYRYDVDRWLKDKKEALQSWRSARKNRKFIMKNRREISAGDFDNSNAIWLFEKAPNELGTGTIRAVNEEYGVEIANLFSDGLRQYWKTHDTSYAERRTYLGHIGLAGVNLDYSYGELPSDADLARKAFRYAFHELNGFPEWVEELATNFPTQFCSEVKGALLADFNSEHCDGGDQVSDCISKIAYSGSGIRNLVAPMLLRMLMIALPRNRRDRMLCLDIVARAPTVELNRLSRFLVSGYRAATTRFDFREAWEWLGGIMNANSGAAINVLALTFTELDSVAQKALYFEFLAREENKPALVEGAGHVRREYGRDSNLLEWLVRASYLAWPPEKDVRHESVYSPGKNDHAESSRRNYINMLVALQTPDAIDALARLSRSKQLSSYRDTFLYQIELMRRKSGRRAELSRDEAIQFLNDQSKPPASVEEFRKLCQIHLEALLEKLHTSDDDESAFFRRGHAKEGDLRNWLAGRLRDVGERYYTVIREQEVAGEKRPDLRLHSRFEFLGKVSVEIKLAEMKHWTGNQLVSTPSEQLSNQYLFETSSHTGIYVLVNASHPRKVEKDKKTKKVKRSAFRKTVDGKAVNFEELVKCVQEKCTAINQVRNDGKKVIAITRDISEKPSDTI